MRLFWAISKWAFIGLCFLLLMLLATAILLSRAPQDVGCYWAADIVLGIMCRGFPGSQIAIVVLNLPLWAFYVTRMLWHDFMVGRFVEKALKWPHWIAFGLGSVCWLALGLAYPIRWLFLSLRRPSQA